MSILCLVVDDSLVTRRIERDIVESFGFQCREAEDGNQALHACRAEMPAAILLDWNMPTMNGYEFLVALRKLPKGGNPVVIFCTTENERPKIMQALDSGANEYIMKPFDAAIVREKFVQTGLLEAQ